MKVNWLKAEKSEAHALTKQDVARLGEQLAEKFLRMRGFSILERNFHTPFGEIDIVGQRDGCVSFVEVKTRTSEAFGPPLSSININKKRNIIRNCLFYIQRRGLCESACRIDCVGIKLSSSGKMETLQYIKNAIDMTEIYI